MTHAGRWCWEMESGCNIHPTKLAENTLFFAGNYSYFWCQLRKASQTARPGFPTWGVSRYETPLPHTHCRVLEPHGHRSLFSQQPPVQLQRRADLDALPHPHERAP